LSDFDSRLQQLDSHVADADALSLDIDAGVDTDLMAGSTAEELASLNDGLAFAVLAVEEELPDTMAVGTGADEPMPGFELLSGLPEIGSPGADETDTPAAADFDTDFLSALPEPVADTPDTGLPEADSGVSGRVEDWLSPVPAAAVADEHAEPPLTDWLVTETPGVAAAPARVADMAAQHRPTAPAVSGATPAAPMAPPAPPASPPTSLDTDTAPTEALEAETPGPERLRANLGEEIYDIFVEEITEISTSLQEWVPQWTQQRDNRSLLTDIRRAWHTCKGSGRMAGALALGDYAWAHENLLNRVLEGGISANDGVTTLLGRAVRYLQRRLDYFLAAETADAGVKQQIERVEAFMAAPEQPLAAESTGAAVAPVSSGSAQPPAVSGAAAQEKPEAEPRVVVGRPVPASQFRTLPLPAPVPVLQAGAGDEELEESRIIRELFREELPEQLRSIDRNMQLLTADLSDDEVRRSLERDLHTLKGSARMAQWLDLGNESHQAEDLLVQLGRPQGRGDVTVLERLQTHVDRVSQLAEHYLQGGSSASADKAADRMDDAEAGVDGVEDDRLQVHAGAETHGSLLERLLAEQMDSLPPLSILSGHADEDHAGAALAEPDSLAALAAQEQIRLPAAMLDRVIEASNSLNMYHNNMTERLQVMTEDVGEFGRTVARLRQLLRALELETEAQIHAGYRAERQKAQDSSFDALEMDQYSEIQRLSRALAESLNDLVNIEGDLGQQLRVGVQANKESHQISRNLHQDLMDTRLVEVALIVPRLRRIVRQSATELDKQLELAIEGETLKLDRHLLQRMTAPIEHLLRNSVAHGIELPQVRSGAGKQPAGTIRLRVFRAETEVVFEISDDGRGLDPEQLRAKALELGLIGADEKPGRQETLRLILHSGFSTSGSVNQLSGRGVGMDVVNAEVKALGGALQIDSVKGQGAAFTIRLPFTMTANPVLFVSLQQQTYALPLGIVQGLERLDAAKIREHLGRRDNPVLRSNENWPLYDLGQALGHEQPLALADDRVYPVVFSRIGEHNIAWLVEAIGGRRDVLLHSLGALFRSCRFYSAATISSDGQVVLLPEMQELVRRVQSGRMPGLSRAQSRSVQVRRRHEQPHILVVDDSITVRKVTEKFLISERFKVESAKDGLEALEKLNHFEPDLLLLDIEMPRMDGFEVLSAVRREERWKTLPVIMISSRTAEKHQEHARQLGASDFLGKPYQNPVLLAHIQRHLRQRQTADAT